MKRKIFLISGLLALVMLSCGLVACGGKGNNAAPPENDYMITYRSDWQGENDADMYIDGSLDEDRWQNKNWYTTCAPYGAVNESVWMKTTAFTTEYGVYIAAVLYDDNIVGDGEFNVTQGTCLEYHYTFRKQDGKLYNASYADRGRFFLDVFGNYCTKGERMKRGVKVDGVVNSGNTVSATFEVFVPWEQTGVAVTDTWYPEEVYVLPGCRVLAEGQTYSLCTLGMVSERWRRDYQAMYYEFDENGYTKVDTEGASLGDAKNGFAKSAGWNLDKLSEGEVSLDKTYEYDYIFFRDAFANNFEASMTIYPGEYLYDLTDNGIVYDTNGLAMYRDGRAGFYLLTTTGQEFVPYLEYNNLVDTKVDGVKAPAKYHLRSLDNFVSAWHVSDDVCDIENTEKAGAVEFSMIKYGADLFYFADGIYLGTQRVSSLNDSVYVGLYNCNRAATYKNYDFTAYSDSEAQERLHEKDIYAVHATAQSGGRVECEQTWVKKGEVVTFKAICESGYTVKTIKIGETDITAECKNSVQPYGKYSVTVTDTADISVAFGKLTSASEISGMVYSGDDEKPSAATLKFASLSDASVVYSVRATSAKGYSVTLPDGEYSVFVTFGTKDSATQKITVKGDGTHDIRSTPLNVEIGNIKITDEGYYATEYSVTNTRCYIDTATSGQPFIMETTVKDMSDKTWPSVGFILSTGGNNWIKFVLRLACPGDVTDYYDTLIWHDVYDNPESPYYVRVVNFDDNALKTNPFTGKNNTAKLRLVYTGKVYYFYVNDTLIFRIDEDEAIQAGESHTIASTLGEGEVRLGLFAERQITFTDWNVSETYDDIWDLLGGTVTATGFELAVGDKTVIDGKVLLGDEVTVSVAAQSNGTFMLDGNMIATQVVDGKSVAKFTVTSKNHVVTYTASYAVSGSVANGNADTVVTIANEQGAVVYTGNTDASGNYSATLADGTYYVSAQSATQITNVATVTVSGAAATVGEIAFTKPIINDWATGNRYTIDYKTGNYVSAPTQDQNGGWFAGIELNRNSYYVLETTVKDMPTPADLYPSVGYMVGTNDNWLRFTVQWVKDNSTYRFVLWRSNRDPIVGNTINNPFANGSMNVKLVYANGTYYFYANSALVYTTTESVGSGATHVGLFNDWQITFTDWNYSSGRDAVQSYLGKELNVAEHVEVKINGESATVASGKVNVLIGDKVTASVEAEEGKTFNIVLDGNGIETKQDNGKAVAEFTVSDTHSVSYSVAYAVTGSVTNGDENTVITIVGENGAVAYTGNAKADGTFTATLANGTYYVSAQNATHITNVVSLTVNDALVSVDAISFTKPLITDWIADYNHYVVDYTTGEYKSVEGQQFHGGWFAENATEVYKLTASVKDMTDTANWSCVGFMVGTNDNWLRFTVQYNKDNGTYRFVLWRSSGNPTVGQNVENPFENGSMDLKLVYANGTYYFYANGALVYTATESVGGTHRVGLYNEYRITFADWNYTGGRDAVENELGKTLTVANGMEVKINGESATVTNGTVKVLLGDKITVSIPIATGESFNILLDGNGYETKQENGKAVAVLTVTNDHTVNYSIAYAVSGTVTGGDENTTVTIAGANGVIAYTGKANSDGTFAANLANGTYYVSAQSATQITNIVTVTVASGAATVNALAFVKPIINDWLTDHRYDLDYTTGNYSSADVDKNGGWFAGVTNKTYYTLEATVKDMPAPANGSGLYPSFGFMVGTAEKALRFTVQYASDGPFHRYVIWDQNSGVVAVQDGNFGTLFTDGDDVKIKLVHDAAGYKFYVNDELVYTSTETFSDDAHVGLFNEWQITFTDWSYTETVA